MSEPIIFPTKTNCYVIDDAELQEIIRKLEAKKLRITELEIKTEIFRRDGMLEWCKNNRKPKSIRGAKTFVTKWLSNYADKRRNARSIYSNESELRSPLEQWS